MDRAGCAERRAACHHGPYRTFHRAYPALGRWIEANGYDITGPARDIYLQGGAEQDDPTYIIELQFPVERR